MNKLGVIFLGAGLIVLLSGCVGAHIYTGADDKRLEDMTIVLRLGNFGSVQRCADTIVPVLGYSTFTTEPLADRHKNLALKMWETDRPKDPPRSLQLPLVKDYRNNVEFAECEVCSVADKDIVWEEIISRCTGGTSLTDFGF